jgi:arginase
MRGVGAINLSESDIILADARDLDPGERDALERSEVRRSADLAKVPRMIPPGRPVYVHLDPDVIDPLDAPAMHYPAKGGRTAGEVSVLARALASTGQVIAVSMTLWDLPADQDGRTARSCLGALNALVGARP